MDCWRGIVDYMNNAPGAARDGWHGNITSWFYWSWNPDSIGAPYVSDTCRFHHAATVTAQPSRAAVMMQTAATAAPCCNRVCQCKGQQLIWQA